MNFWKAINCTTTVIYLNPRILKKLSKRADPIVAKHTHKQRVLVGRYDREGVETSQKIDREHLERWDGRPNRYNYFTAKKGTVVYGSMVGYYEPEWEELDAYSLLEQMVTCHFTDWDDRGLDGHGKLTIKLGSPARVFAAAAFL